MSNTHFFSLWVVLAINNHARFAPAEVDPALR
jgi:hypothetical protein